VLWIGVEERPAEDFLATEGIVSEVLVQTAAARDALGK
jgi:hypothetical protein